MRDFREIFEISAGRHGGAEVLEDRLGTPKTAAQLGQVPEGRWLAEMSNSCFGPDSTGA